MLSKIWKKVLLAICVVAILFNITSKLVNRVSLETTITNAEDGVDVKELFNITEDENTTETSTSSYYEEDTEEEADYSVEEETYEEDEYVEEEIDEEESEATDITSFTTLLY